MGTDAGWKGADTFFSRIKDLVQEMVSAPDPDLKEREILTEENKLQTHAGNLERKKEAFTEVNAVINGTIKRPVDLDPNIEIVIIAGELANNFGFKTDTESVITSPGVEINLKEGDIVRIIFLNEGEVPHSFAITGQPESTALTLFKSDIGGPSSPIQPGATSETIIILDKPGTYYYVCTVPVSYTHLTLPTILLV